MPRRYQPGFQCDLCEMWFPAESQYVLDGIPTGACRSCARSKLEGAYLRVWREDWTTEVRTQARAERTFLRLQEEVWEERPRYRVRPWPIQRD